MNIIEAMKAAKNGKRLKRKEWNIEIFIFTNAFWIFKSTSMFTLEVDDILANDWEVVG